MESTTSNGTSLGRIYDEAVLRRHPLEDGLPGGGKGREEGERAGTLKNRGAFRQLQQKLALNNDLYKED